jgi:hypothetical protein
MEGPDTLVVGWQGKAGLWVVPRRFEAQSQIRRVVADLSALGGGSEVVLQEQADGTYAADLPLRVEGVNGTREISVRIDQSTSLGPYWTRLSRQVAVFPAADLMIFADALAEAWTLSTQHTVKVLPEEKTVAQGQKALAVQTNGIWRVACQPPVAVGLVGYRALRLAVHPGDVSEGVIDVGVNGKKVNVVPGKEGQRVDLGVKQYQVVELPLELFSMQESLQGLSISGKATGTVYLDDIRLVAARPSSVPGTAVLESQTNTLPTAFSLAQNHPNPFNSDTLIRFSLPTRAQVSLTLYNLTGQQVATLVEGARDGGEYEVTWDGRSPEGGALASGVYLYHLQVGGQGMTRKLLLLR